MGSVLEKMPVQAFIMDPLFPLAELPSHEQELFAWLGKHVTQEDSQVGEFLPIVPRHLAQQRALALDDFVMRKRQDKVLMECVQHPKGQVVVMVFSVDGVLGDVLQRIVHPPHVPFQTKAETADVIWP